MRTAVKFLCSVGLTTLSRGSHPFVGEHADADQFTYEDGTVAMRMKPRFSAPKSVNKYEHLIDRSKTYSAPQNTIQIIQESLYGKNEDKLALEMGIENYLANNQRKYGRKRLGQSSVGVALDTVDGATWTGTIYMGKFSPMDVVFDTGSDWLVVESDRCDTCEGNTYDSSKGTQLTTTESQRFYGSLILKGVEHKDEVCLLLSQCIQNFEYFAITEQNGMKEPIDGILGLSRGNQFYIENYWKGNRKPGPLLVEEMY